MLKESLLKGSELHFIILFSPIALETKNTEDKYPHKNIPVYILLVQFRWDCGDAESCSIRSSILSTILHIIPSDLLHLHHRSDLSMSRHLKSHISASFRVFPLFPFSQRQIQVLRIVGEQFIKPQGEEIFPHGSCQL